ncbi:MAG: AAA family ATPase [Gammaproteobacteria bacterium]|nr:AAA family ATPase [Gammaproteobacteria bacterium]
MLQSIDIKKLTVFSEISCRFSPQLNVISGENGTGKSHLLKLAYAVLAASAEEGRKTNASPPAKALLQKALAKKLGGVFRPENLGRLVRRKQGRGRCEIGLAFAESELAIEFSFAAMSKSEVSIDKLPISWADKFPVFLPARELLTIYPGFVSVYDNHYLEFEETSRDTCVLLGAPILRGPKEKRVKELLAPLEKAMGGGIVLDKNGRFYLNISGQGQLEMPLAAEGLRKLATLARLIATGFLLDKGYLFWDEPEANLNPKLIKKAAHAILKLGQSGIQVFIATHSLFLMRELDILMRTSEFKEIKARFFGLQPDKEGIIAEQGDDVDSISAISSLDEELSQSDRYLETE